MAYDEFLADRIRQVFVEKRVAFEEKKMMGGLCFMVDDKMCFGINNDKTTNSPKMMARIGDEAVESALKQKGCREFDMTGRPMKSFVTIDAEGLDMQEDLEYWIQLCLDFNPKAKRSKKRKKKLKKEL